MGRLLKAQCSNCGYESGLLRVDAGRRTAATYFGVPARCFVERAVVTVNLRAHHAAAGEDWDDAGFGTAALESGEQDAAADLAPPEYSPGPTMSSIRRDMLAAEERDQPAGAEWPDEAEARLDYEAGNPIEPDTTPDPDWEELEDEEAEASRQWPADRDDDPGPVDDETAGEMEPTEWFPADRQEDPGPAAGATSDRTTQEIPRGPWTLKNKEIGRERSQEDAPRSLPTETRTSFGLVATPVEPHTTLPQTAEEGAPSADAASLEFTGGEAPDVPPGSVVAYPCPNDGSATTVYEAHAEHITGPQTCPRCEEQALTFSVEGHWD